MISIKCKQKEKELTTPMFDSKIGICTFFFLFMCTQGHGKKRET